MVTTRKLDAPLHAELACSAASALSGLACRIIETSNAAASARTLGEGSLTPLRDRATRDFEETWREYASRRNISLLSLFIGFGRYGSDTSRKI